MPDQQTTTVTIFTDSYDKLQQVKYQLQARDSRRFNNAQALEEIIAFYAKHHPKGDR